MSILKKAENKMAYAKVGLYGTAGSGKTRTAVEIAIGLHKAIGSTKPIAAFDTEPAFSFVLPLFNAAYRVPGETEYGLLVWTNELLERTLWTAGRKAA